MSDLILFGGVALLAVPVALTAYALVAPRPPRLDAERRRPVDGASDTALTKGATAATAAISRVLERRGAGDTDSLLARVGLKSRPQDFVFLVVVGMLVTGAFGMVLANLLVGVFLMALVPVLTRVVLGVMEGRRKAAFAEQLDDSLQLLSGSLRAGHSLLQALDSVANEAEEPTSEEFSRIINETRVGRELNDSLRGAAERMGSEDFMWVTQAIAINREVGGNLADVLDRIGHTIRERGQIRRQVKALAAEGKLSAIVLMALPFGITAFLLVANPGYIMKFTHSLLGYGLIVLAAIMLLVGAVWLRKVVQIKF